MPQIVVERPEGSLVDRFRSYRVMIDGEYRGSIRQKEKWAYSVPAGTHTVVFRINYYCTPPLKIAVVNRTRVICRSGVAQAFGVVALFSPNSWLSIREEDDGTDAAVADGGVAEPGGHAEPQTAPLVQGKAKLAWPKRLTRGTGEWSFRLSSAKMDAATKKSRLLELDLRDAVASRGFQLRYEPQINLGGPKVVAFEALLRWEHPERGLVSAREFIPLAEKIGLMGAIGQQALEEACMEARSWPDDIAVAVNVAEQQLVDSAWPAIVAMALKNAGLRPSRLELEVIGSVFLNANPVAIAALQALRQMGVRITLDCFDTDDLALRHIRPIPFDKIKIKRTVVNAPDDSEAVIAVVREALAFSVGHAIPCCAVGVETKDQLDRLVEVGCAQVQGHLFGQAMEARDIVAALARINLGDWAPGTTIMQSHPGVSFLQVAEVASDVIIVTTADLDEPGPTITYVNPAFCRLTGYSAAEAIGRSPRMLQGPGTSRATIDRMRQNLREGRVVREKLVNYAKCGAPYWLDMRIVPLRGADGTITHFASIQRDVTLDKRRLDELEVAENRDILTGVPNRRGLLMALETEIERARDRADEGAATEALCFASIGINRFSQLREDIGDAGADAVLQGLADRLAENVRRSDTLGRMDAEVFGICMPSMSLAGAGAIVEHLHGVAALPLATPSGPVSISVSIGLSTLGESDSVARIVHRADEAMRAKQQAAERHAAAEHAVQADGAAAVAPSLAARGRRDAGKVAPLAGVRAAGGAG
jgi:diguanylate cyclase (GGDEF)-like protein/PAS domain S-box-containing protein